MKNYVEMIFILDRSGSMAGMEKETIGGFNGLITKQKEEAGDALVTTVLFDHEMKVIHERQDLKTIAPMTSKDYYVRGSTALLDAIGTTVKKMSEIHKTMKKKARPEKVIVVITTDGYENASRHYRRADIKKMIEKKQKKGWEFLFLGANMDAIDEAEGLGIEASRAATYHNDEKGIQTNYMSVGRALASMRRNEEFDEAWKEEIDADFKSRS